MKKFSVLCFVLLSSLMFSSLAQGQNLQEEPQTPQWLKFEIGTEVTNAYFYRGINQEDNGFVAQPYLNTNATVTEKLSVDLNFWNSVHSAEVYNSDSSVDAWYETRFSIFANYQLTTDLKGRVGYLIANSPSDSFETIQEFSAGLYYTDPFNLNPHVLIATETQSARDGGSTGTYAEIGIEPKVELYSDKEIAFNLSFPVAVGFSLDDYYGSESNSSFGYLDVGSELRIPLKFIETGDWTLLAGVHVLLLGEDANNYNNNDSVEVIGTVGLAVAF